MLVKVYGSSIHGISARCITVEVNIDKGVGYYLVGLPDNAIKESSHRISAALKNVGYKLPGRKITINMAPADLRKEGSAYDLTIAIGILAANNSIKAENLVSILKEDASLHYLALKIQKRLLKTNSKIFSFPPHMK